MGTYAIGLNAVVVGYEELPDGVRVLTTSCEDYDRYKSLPQVVEYDGRVFGRTGWNSDRCIAYYRTDARIAHIRVGADQAGIQF